MTTAQQTHDYLTHGMRWIARLIGLLASGLYVLFVICVGARIYPTLSWSSPRGMPLFIALAITAISVLIAWRWEMIGGAMAVLGAVTLGTLVYFGSGRAVFSTALMISSPYFVAGVLFLACCRRARTGVASAGSMNR